jgi:hypothetical protein
MRSPIEIMIDRATGREATPPVRSSDIVLLRCPTCKRKKHTIADASDPKGTHEVEVNCPKCMKGGAFEEIHYYGKDGQEILAQENEEAHLRVGERKP